MSPDLNEKYWNDRYLEKNAGWDIGDISAPLKAYFDQLDNKHISVLIPGAGNAYEAGYLFNLGFRNVYVCDIASEAIRSFKKRCPGFSEKNILHGDFFELNNGKRPEYSFDLIVEQTFFCALHPTLRRNYAEQVCALLKPGGKLVGVLFNDPLNTNQPPFGGTKEEYLGYFSPLFKINTFEDCYNSIKPRAGRELFINLVKK